MKKYFVLLLFVSISFLVQAKTVSITIAKSFLNEYKPVVILIHDYDGEVIYVEKIRKGALKKDYKLEFDNQNYENFALTSYTIREFNDKGYFVNFSFLGISNGYVLKFERTYTDFQNDTLFRHSVELIDQKPNSIQKIVNGRSRSPHGTIVNCMVEKESPLFFLFSTEEMFHYYFLNDEIREKKHCQFKAGVNDLGIVSDVYDLSFSEPAYRSFFRAHSNLINQPILFSFQIPDTTTYHLPFPDDLEITHFDVIVTKTQSDSINHIYRNVEQYFTIEELPFTVDSFDRSVFIEQNDQREFKLNTSSQYKFYKGTFSFIPLVGKWSSAWMVYGSLPKESSFILPDLPERVLNKFPVLDIVDMDIQGHVDFISTEKNGIRIDNLSSPFLIDSADWRIENSSTVVTQYIPIR